MAEILHQLTIAADPEAVYEALTTEDGLANWWTRDATAETRQGGTAVFGFNRHGVVFTMTIDELEPGSKLVWRCTAGPDEWVGTQVTFALSRTPDRTRVDFRHEGWERTDGMLPRCSFDWARYLLSLKSYLETGEGRPHRG